LGKINNRRSLSGGAANSDFQLCVNEVRLFGLASRGRRPWPVSGPGQAPTEAAPVQELWWLYKRWPGSAFFRRILLNFRLPRFVTYRWDREQQRAHVQLQTILFLFKLETTIFAVSVLCASIFCQFPPFFLFP